MGNFHCTEGKKYHFWKKGGGQKYHNLGKYTPLHDPLANAFKKCLQAFNDLIE